MVRLIDLVSTPKARRSRFVGRVREVQEFRNVLRYVLCKEDPPGGSLLFPHIFLPYGEGGMGKSMLLQRFRTVALEEGWPEERIVVVDLDYQQFPTPEALAKKLVERIGDRFPGFDESYQLARASRERLGGRFREVQSRWAMLQALGSKPGEIQDHFRRLLDRLREVERQASRHGDAHKPLDLAHEQETVTAQLAWLSPYAEDPGGVPVSFEGFLNREMGADAALFRAGEGIGKAFADDLYRLAEAAPLLLAIDTYERADQHDDWLRTNILTSVSSRMLAVIAGRNRLDEGYRRTFVGDLINLVRPNNLNDQTFQAEEVREYLRLRLNQTQDPEPALVDEVLGISRGVPVAVEALGDQLAGDGTLGPYKGLELKTLDRRTVVRTVTERFLRSAVDDDTDSPDGRHHERGDRQHIRSLAILLRPDAELACAFWGVPAEQGQARVDRLADRYSFIFAGYGPYEIHDLVRDFVRQDTQTAWRQTFDWPYFEAGLLRVLARVDDRLDQLVGAHANGDRGWNDNPEERFRDSEWQAMVLDKLNALLWLGEHKTALRLLIGSDLGGQAFNPFFGHQLVSLARELAPRTGEWPQILAALELSNGADTALTQYSDLLDSHGRAILNYIRAGPLQHWDWSINDPGDAELSRLDSRVNHLSQALKDVPSWSLPVRELAQTHMNRAFNRTRKQQYPQAAVDAERAFNLDRNLFTPTERVVLGSLRRHNGDSEGAISVLNEVLTERPEFAAALHERGHARQALRELDGAISDFHRCQQLEPNDPVHVKCGALVRCQLGDNARALAELDRALALMPDDTDLLACRVHVRYASRDYSGALEDLDRALVLKPEDTLLVHGRWLARKSFGDYSGALEDVDRALVFKPDEADLLACRHGVRTSPADYAGALADLDRALTLKPEDIALLRARNATRGESGDFEGAIADLDRILRQKPDDVGALVRLAFRKFQLLGAEAAEPPDLDAVAASDLKESAYMMGCLRAHQGRRPEALRWLEQALRRDPCQRSWMPRDPDLRPLHDDPGFQALIRADDRESASPVIWPQI